jgi:hypothetical protein
MLTAIGRENPPARPPSNFKSPVWPLMLADKFPTLVVPAGNGALAAMRDAAAGLAVTVILASICLSRNFPSFVKENMLLGSGMAVTSE